MKVKVYGCGWVGKAMLSLFPDAVVCDKPLGLFDDTPADVAFVCVPTNLVDGQLDTSVVEEVVAQSQESLIIIRSTVMPGTCDRLATKYGKNIVYQPEYLGETTAHPLFDQAERGFLILGGDQHNTRKAIEVYQKAYNANIQIRQTTLLEAEVIKLSENRAIAFKIGQCQELYDACEAAGVDYYVVRDAVYGDDPRFNLWWTFVYPENRGFSSKCIPKDVYGWAAWAESVGVAPELTRRLLETNEVYLANR